MRDDEVRSAGWYADSSMANTQRYWDGLRWTDHVAPMGPAGSVSDAGNNSDKVAGGALKAVFVVVLLVVGFGIALLSLSLISEAPGMLLGVLMIGAAAAMAALSKRPRERSRPWAWWELAILAGLGLVVLVGLIQLEQNRQRDERLGVCISSDYQDC